MMWQVNYALQYFGKDSESPTAEQVCEEVIKIYTSDQPDALAVISAAETINKETAAQYHQAQPDMDFLCGYRKTCVWEGETISYLEENRIGWGNFGTLCSSVAQGKANTTAHKVFAFSDRLIRQFGLVEKVEREFDRVYQLKLKNSRLLRVGMIADYEPTADAVRCLWERFGPVNIVWNINPNGNPTASAIKAGHELGCEVLKWEELRANMENV